MQRVATSVLMAVLVAGVLVLVGCGEAGPNEAGAAQATPETEPESTTPQPSTDASEQPAPKPEPEVIDQSDRGGSAPNTKPEPGEDAEPDDHAAANDEPSDSSLVGLPGYVPPKGSDDANTAATFAPGSPVVMKAMVVELTAENSAELAPLRAFLEGGEDATLDPSERAALDELIAALAERDVVRVVTAPSLVVEEGESGSLAVGDEASGSVGLELAPRFLTNADNSLRAVEIGFTLIVAEDGADLPILSDGLALPAGASGSRGAVANQDTFFFVRRAVDDDTDREFLVLVTPRAMAGGVTK